MALAISAPSSISAGSSLAVSVSGFSTTAETPAGSIFFLVGAPPPVGSPAIPIDPVKNGEIFTPNSAGVIAVSFQILSTAPPGVYGINAVDLGLGQTTPTTKQITITAPGTEPPSSGGSKILLIVAALAVLTGALGGRRRKG